MRSKWFLWPPSQTQDRTTLVCVPWAGGSASGYTRWRGTAPEQLTVTAVQPPGRETRSSEPAAEDFTAYVRDIAWEIAAIPGPVVLFGHSLGAVVAHAVAVKLQTSMARPVARLIVSGSAPPTGFPPAATRRIDVRDLGGVPAAVLKHRVFIEALERNLRADRRLMTSYRAVDGWSTRLTSPMLVLGGDTDPLVPVHALEGWRPFADDVEVLNLAGGHFFIHDHTDVVFHAALKAHCRS
jgi:pyochelin biosynthesis protein PchC